MRLLYLDIEAFEKLITQFDKDIKAIKTELLNMCWHMRGGLTYNEAHNLTPEERNWISKLIDDHVEVTNKTGLPFF